MARKRNGRKKVEPAEYTILVNTPTTAAGTTAQYTLDLSQIASQVNRRFYRQGLQWAVSGIKIISGSTSTIFVKKLPNTWVFTNAWTKGFRIWQEEQKKVYELAPGVRPKYEDYKIFADRDHHLAGVIGNLEVIDSNGVAYAKGKWNTSRYHIPNNINSGTTADVDILGVGGSWPGPSPVTGRNAVSLIEGYAASRALPNTQDPETPDDMEDARPGPAPENYFAAMQSEGLEQIDDIITGIANDNDQPPYAYENGDIPFVGGQYTDTQYPGGANNASALQLHDIVNITGTTIGNMTMVKGGMFNCGLIRIQHEVPASGSVDHNLAIQIELVPGDHKGYACRPMLEV